MTRTLLVQIRVPHFMGYDALLTSLTSLTASPRHLLAVKYPFVISTLIVTSLPCLPWVFGCIAFVHDHTPNTSKLAPHSVKGVLVGYSHMQKSYRVYFPS